MFKRILVAIDGSRTADRGFKAALNMAKEQDAQLHILHVVDARAPVLYPDGSAYVDEIISLLRDGGKKILGKAEAAASSAGVKYKSTMVETMGLPVADVIVQQAKKLRADVIVLGTHGRRGLSRLVMGSDAEGVLREASVPVMLIKSPPSRGK